MDKSFLIFLAIPIFFLMIGIELTYGLLKGKNTYRLNDTITSINIGLISRFPTILNLGFQGVVFSYAAKNLNLFQLPINSPFTWILAFVLYDFLYYWMHRLHHEYKFLWATHAVHHHGEEFNLSTALRQTSSGFLWKWIFFVPILLIGIPSVVFVAVGGLNLIYQFWVHTEHIGKLGWYEKYFISPSNHRIHHAKNPEYIDKNYGGVFILWDRFFGTYCEEKDEIKPVYGTVKALRSWNPVWANIEVFISMFKDSYYTKNWKDKIKVWFAKTTWRPKDVELKFPNKEFEQNEKFNTDMSSTLSKFVWLQLIFIPVLTMVVFFTLNNQLFIETVSFGLFLIASSLIISFALSNRGFVLYLEIFRSLIIILSIMYLNILSLDLLATQILLIHSAINLLVIIPMIIGTKNKPAHY
ncbi:MAG: sterol desaturase family protein [Pseudomonadota bacterium]|nr:sterol desaturase family protein [Pseudomonadota bacterium]MEC9458368.1 sterol desaturase family protein [Pseudomonadota bacterium]MED5436984.1 sterol desaturase family protein [Pseudomonadota bacterium]